MSRYLSNKKEKRILVIITTLVVIAISISLLHSSFSLPSPRSDGTAIIVVSRDIDPSGFQYITVPQQTLSSYPKLLNFIGMADTDYANYLTWCKKTGCDNGVISSPYFAPPRAPLILDDDEAKKIISDLGFHDIPNIPSQQNLKSLGHYIHLEYNGNHYTIKISGILIP